VIRIYVFGGGQAQRCRFNDTLKLRLPDVTDSDGLITTKTRQTDDCTARTSV